MASSCCALVLSPSEVFKEVKDFRKKAFDSKSLGYEMGMQQCPNCKQMGLFVHDGMLARCVHPEHESICAANNKELAEEAAAAKRLAEEPRWRKCTTCACKAMIAPGEFRPADGDERSRCDNHQCLDKDNIEIAVDGQCDGCMQVSCARCDRCKCYRSDYSTGRCKSCKALNLENSGLYPLTPAFPENNKRKLVICNMCVTLERQRTGIAEEARKQKAQTIRHVPNQEGRVKVRGENKTTSKEVARGMYKG